MDERSDIRIPLIFRNRNDTVTFHDTDRANNSDANAIMITLKVVADYDGRLSWLINLDSDVSIVRNPVIDGRDGPLVRDEGMSPP